MIITCKNCNTSFNLDESLLKPTGSNVRCSKCANIFTAYPETIADMPDETPEKIYTPEPEDVKEEITEGDVSDIEKIEEEAGKESEELGLELDAEPIEKIEEEATTEDKPVEEELDLSDLKLEDEPEPEEAGKESEELELELDAEPIEKIEEEAATEDKPVEEELDLSDLKLEDEPEPEEAGKESEELELELDAEPIEKIEEEATTEYKPVEKEPDLSEIEEMLDAEDKPKPEDKEDLEVEEKFDLSDIDLEDKAESEETKEEPEKLDLESKADMEPVAEESKADVEPVVEEGKADVEPVVEEGKADVEPVAEESIEEAEKELKTAGKKQISTPLLILLIIVLLAGGAYGTYLVLDSMNIKIPFISSFLKPEIQDPGNLKITVLDINGKFVNNAKIGNLFIITGTIKNNYPKARSFIKVTGKLYTKEKIISESATVYCGNTISDAELASLDINEINKILSNRLGTNKTNINIKPGKQLPFMIIFTNIPDNIEEYTIEVASSSPA